MPNPIPEINIKHDRFYHWPRTVELNAPFDCRHNGCTSRFKVICTKCKVYLCMSKSKTCFKFHCIVKY